MIYVIVALSIICAGLVVVAWTLFAYVVDLQDEVNDQAVRIDELNKAYSQERMKNLLEVS